MSLIYLKRAQRSPLKAKRYKKLAMRTKAPWGLEGK